MLGLSCYILADTFFVAQSLGADGLAALNIAIPVYSLINGSGLMLGTGGAVRYAVCMGRGNRDEAAQGAVPHAAAGRAAVRRIPANGPILFGRSGAPFRGAGDALPP